MTAKAPGADCTSAVTCGLGYELRLLYCCVLLLLLLLLGCGKGAAVTS
jgi:hypothetical protein